MNLLTTVSLGMIATVASAGSLGNAGLIASINQLKAAVTNKLDVDNSSCKQGNQDGCQNVFLDTVQLNNVNSELALRKLQSSVRSSETRDLIDEAIDKLSDVDSAISEVEDRLDE